MSFLFLSKIFYRRVLHSRKEARLQYFRDKMGRKKGIDKPCNSNAVDFGSPVKSNLSELAGFSLEDREKLTSILESMKSPKIQVQRLNKKLETNTKEIGKSKDENVKLKQALSLAVYNVDALEQYERRKNIRIHGVAEKINSNKDDGEEVVANIAGELGIDINECDVQSGHRLGKKKKSPGGKPQQISARFISHKIETNYCMQKKFERKQKLLESLSYRGPNAPTFKTTELRKIRMQ